MSRSAIVNHGTFNTWTQLMHASNGEFILYFGFPGSNEFYRSVVELSWEERSFLDRSAADAKIASKMVAKVNWSALGSTAEPAKVRLFALMLTMAHELMVALNEGWITPQHACRVYGNVSEEDFTLAMKEGGR